MRLALPVAVAGDAGVAGTDPDKPGERDGKAGALMLEELDIRNLGPIREATIAPAAGMTAITGETGAGKSMLLSAIRLVSGGAAESSRVSAGADEAWAQAIFALADDAVASEHSGDTNDAGSGDADSGFTGAAAAVAKAHDAGRRPRRRRTVPFPAPYALPDVRGPCSAASPYRVRCWGPSPANWLPFMARPIS